MLLGMRARIKIKRMDEDRSDGYSQVGVTTGKTTGGIFDDNLSVSGCHDLRGEGFAGGAEGAKGDSGGPLYTIENGYACILGHLHGISNTKLTDVESCSGESYDRKNTTIGFPAYEVAGDGFNIGGGQIC
jgi:hypothetical protein